MGVSGEGGSRVRIGYRIPRSMLKFQAQITFRGLWDSESLKIGSLFSQARGQKPVRNLTYPIASSIAPFILLGLYHYSTAKNHKPRHPLEGVLENLKS